MNMKPVTDRVFTLQIGRNATIAFSGSLFSTRVKLGDFETELLRPIYRNRIDDRQVIVMPDLPPDEMRVHGCVSAACKVMTQSRQEHLVYEDTADQAVDPKQIVRSTARLYGVDPSEMMAQYPNVRSYLSSTDYIAPVTIESVIEELRLRGTAKIIGRVTR